jgi:DNA-binding MarR family transcriptional regulator
MCADTKTKTHEIISLIAEFSKNFRCFQQEEVFCENITFLQFYILHQVDQCQRLKLADLHKILSVDKSTTTRLVSPLVKQKLIERNKVDNDSRAIELVLTTRGKETHCKVWECLSRFVDSVYSNIPDGKSVDVMEGVRIFLKAIGMACTNNQCKPQGCINNMAKNR